MAWTNSFTRLTGAIGFLGLIPALAAMKRHLEARLEIARETGGEGLIAELVRVENEGGHISASEMVAMVFLLLGAGTETTTHLISGSVYELTRNPALRDWLEEDWSRNNLAIEEFLRFVSPVQFSKARFVRKDVNLGGKPFGAAILLARSETGTPSVSGKRNDIDDRSPRAAWARRPLTVRADRRN
jgi:cytochrome P450 PksS